VDNPIRFIDPDGMEWRGSSTQGYDMWGHPDEKRKEAKEDPVQFPGNTLPGITVTPKWYKKVLAFFHNLTKDRVEGSQPDGFHLVTRGGDPASSVKQKAEHDVDQVNTDLLFPVIAYALAGGRPTGWEYLTPAEMAQRAKEITESSKEMTSDAIIPVVSERCCSQNIFL